MGTFYIIKDWMKAHVYLSVLECSYLSSIGTYGIYRTLTVPWNIVISESSLLTKEHSLLEMTRSSIILLDPSKCNIIY